MNDVPHSQYAFEADLSESEIPKPPESRLGLFSRFLILGLGFLVLQLVVGIVVGGGFILYLSETGVLKNLSDRTQMDQLMKDYAVPVTAVTSLPMTVLCFLLCCVCRRYLDKRPWQSMGFRNPCVGGTSGLEFHPDSPLHTGTTAAPCIGVSRRHRKWTAGLPALGIGLIFGLLPIVLSAGVIFAVGGYRLEDTEWSFVSALMVPVLLCLAFTEEILFRGYLLQNFIDEGRSRFGIVFTAVVFWLVHGLNPGAWSSPVICFNLFGAGIILAQAYLLSGNIWYPTILHFGWNAAQGLLLSIPVSGLVFPGIFRLSPMEGSSAWLTGGDFGLEGSVVVSLIQIILICLFAELLRKRQSSRRPESVPTNSAVLRQVDSTER